MSDEIKPGDVVRVKSGGPKMTVTEVGQDSYGSMKVWCEWFDEKTNKPQTGSFSLVVVDRL
jgi:uncharacterized protein YodC (DUF2158 family)